MPSAGKTVESFYDAVKRRDMSSARRFLDQGLVFYGLFETYRNADEYMKALTGLLAITRSLHIKTIVAQGEDAAVFFDLETSAPAEARTCAPVHDQRTAQRGNPADPLDLWNSISDAKHGRENWRADCAGHLWSP